MPRHPFVVDRLKILRVYRVDASDLVLVVCFSDGYFIDTKKTLYLGEGVDLPGHNRDSRVERLYLLFESCDLRSCFKRIGRSVFESITKVEDRSDQRTEDRDRLQSGNH